jgi:hypothetical protein
VYDCSDLCPNLLTCYGAGVLNTQRQYCFNGDATATGLSVTPGTPLTTVPVAGSTPVYRCNELCPNLGGCYGVGVLTTEPKYCFNQDATETGLFVAPGAAGAPGPNPGTTPVYSCNQFCPNLGNCYGVGVLTTEPKYCFNQDASDTGLRVK